MDLGTERQNNRQGVRERGEREEGQRKRKREER